LGQKNVELVLEKVFAATEGPWGWYFAGKFNSAGGREQFDLFKKSAEAGCSWGQVEYSLYLKDGRGGFVTQSPSAYVAELKKAALQNNPRALELLGGWAEETTVSDAGAYYQAAAELGWATGARLLAGV
jgi:TPR repeat protein